MQVEEKNWIVYVFAHYRGTNWVFVGGVKSNNLPERIIILMNGPRAVFVFLLNNDNW